MAINEEMHCDYSHESTTSPIEYLTTTLM